MLKANGIKINFDSMSDEEFAEYLFAQRQRWISEANQLEIEYLWPLYQEEEHV